MIHIAHVPPLPQKLVYARLDLGKGRCKARQEVAPFIPYWFRHCSRSQSLLLVLRDGQLLQLQESLVHLRPVSRQVYSCDNSDHLTQPKYNNIAAAATEV